MPKKISSPTLIEAAGTKPKTIEEFFGRVNTGTEGVSIARMTSPQGWLEPGQTPEFDEYTLVLTGTLHIRFKDGETRVTEGEGVLVEAGKWVQYSTPEEGGATYLAVCLPAFSPETVHRDNE